MREEAKAEIITGSAPCIETGKGGNWLKTNLEAASSLPTGRAGQVGSSPPPLPSLPAAADLISWGFCRSSGVENDHWEAARGEGPPIPQVPLQGEQPRVGTTARNEATNELSKSQAW